MADIQLLGWSLPALHQSDWPYLLRAGTEVVLIWMAVYWLLRALERISAGGKIKGISLLLAAVVAAWLAARWLDLHAISWLLQTMVGFSAVILIVVFQPELRRLLSKLGGILPHGQQNTGLHLVGPLVEAMMQMAERRIGALIVIERNDRLDNYITSSPLDCELTAKSVVSLFWKDAPMHDGAVIVRAGRIAAAGVILPLTNNIEFKSLSGTRHRAGIGISEDTDALALIVSEETGQISMADRGAFTRGLTRQDLEILFARVFRAAAAGKRA
ncbi:MAG: diadenylate cyclase [Planctomycetes bacterium]|nr:diadenylate cyclase [Planctomycetota bacterium]